MSKTFCEVTTSLRQDDSSLIVSMLLTTPVLPGYDTVMSWCWIILWIYISNVLSLMLVDDVDDEVESTIRRH